jgi:hypothetical protein
MQDSHLESNGPADLAPEVLSPGQLQALSPEPSAAAASPAGEPIDASPAPAAAELFMHPGLGSLQDWQTESSRLQIQELATARTSYRRRRCRRCVCAFRAIVGPRCCVLGPAEAPRLGATRVR